MLRRRQFFGALTTWFASVSGLSAWGQTSSVRGAKQRLGGWHCRTIPTVSRQGQQQPPVITGVAVQPQGSQVAVVGDDHVVSLLDLTHDEFTGHYVRHLDWVRTAQFTPDGSTLLTAGNDGRLLQWNTTTAGEAQELARHDSAILKIAVSRSGRQVATVGFQTEVLVYDLASRRPAASFVGPCNDLSAVAFSPDDTHVAAGGRTGTVCIWSLADGAVVVEFRTLQRRVRSLEFLSDGRLAACGNDGCVALLDPRDPAASRRLPRLPAKLFGLKVLDQNLAATGGSDNHIHLWDLAAERKLETLTGHSGTVTCLDYRPGMLVSGSYDTQIRIWESERQALALPDPSTAESIWK